MNQFQFHLLKVAEGATEVSKEVMKGMQFGLLTTDHTCIKTNIVKIWEELDDLMGAIELLNEEHGFGYVPNRANIDAKKEKILRYRTVSIAKDQVDATNPS